MGLETSGQRRWWFANLARQRGEGRPSHTQVVDVSVEDARGVKEERYTTVAEFRRTEGVRLGDVVIDPTTGKPARVMKLSKSGKIRAADGRPLFPDEPEQVKAWLTTKLSDRRPKFRLGSTKIVPLSELRKR